MHKKSWKSEYETGIEWIDTQHKLFLRLINRLIDYKHGELEGLPLERLLTEIEAYARFHFISEENYMTEIAYPGLKNQQEQHVQLMESLRARIESVREDSENIVDLHMQMLTWLLGHTVDSDKDIGRYVMQSRDAETEPQ